MTSLAFDRPMAIDHKLAVFRVTRRRAGGHPTGALCTTHEDYCPLESRASKCHEMSACGTPMGPDAARRQPERTCHHYQARALHVQDKSRESTQCAPATQTCDTRLPTGHKPSPALPGLLSRPPGTCDSMPLVASGPFHYLC